MKKKLLIFGILILLIGVGIYKPDEAESSLEKIGIRDFVWEKLRSPALDIYEENIKEYLDVLSLSYLLIGIGVLTLILSFRKGKKSMTGQLLYQHLEEINPAELGKKAEKDKEKDVVEEKKEEKSIELPDIEEPETPTATGGIPSTQFQPTSSQMAPSRGATGEGYFNPLKTLFHRVSGGKPSWSQTQIGQPQRVRERRFKCAECNEVFVVKHQENTVTCPSCNTTYRV